MDIIIYIGLIVILGVFFILDKYTTTSNTMFVVIFLSFIGFIMLQSSPIELVDYTKVEKIDSSHYQYEQQDITTSGLGILNVQSFLVLVMVFFMLMAAVNITTGKNNE